MGAIVMVGPIVMDAVLWLDYRRDLNAARTSCAKSAGCSQAAKWPPLSTS
jgi:hypothetical protein